MKFNIRKKFNDFLNNSKDYPLLVGFMAGFYPLVFFYSNNYESINSYQHFLFFIFLFLIVPTIATYVFYKIFDHFPKLNPYKKHFLFIVIVELTAIYLCEVYFLTLRKKTLLVALVIIVFLSFKLYNSYKKVVLFVFLLSIIPFCQCMYIVLYKQLNDTLSWTKQNDNIEKVKFVKRPNVYFIEPDGYIGKEAMQKYPYQYNNKFYDWLESRSFTLYKNFHSNYPSTLASNSSMFSMKQSYREGISASVFSMQDGRSIIGGNNPVVSIFKNNDYKTFFIVKNAYFIQNFKSVNYDYYNIKNHEIPFLNNFSDVQKDVYVDLKESIIKNIKEKRPLFFFVESLSPHHVEFDGKGKAYARKAYFEKIEEANIWIKKSIDLIEKYDPNGIIIINSDHGGWVGLESMVEVMSNKNLNESVFNNLLAIKWDDPIHKEYDQKLKSNVNIFRVLFSYLSEDKTLLKSLEDDTSYKMDL